MRAAARRRETDADQDLVRVYLSEIGRYPLLTKDNEAELAKAIEAGRDARLALGDPKCRPATKAGLRRTIASGDRATTRFVQSNLRLVVSIAKKYQASGVPLLDLIQEGNLGLMHAVEKFDWRKGFKFSTYATWWIRQAITRGIANTGRTIRLPVHASDHAVRLRRARMDLSTRLQREPTRAELADELGVTTERIEEIIRFSRDPASLSSPIGEDDRELADVVEDADAVSPADAATTALLADEVNKMLQPLDLRERAILRLRFGLDGGEGRTLEEVGEHFSLTRERIRQIESKALTKLRHPAFANAGRMLLAD